MIEFFIILLGIVIVITFTFILWVQQTLLNQKTKPIIAIGLYRASAEEITKVHTQDSPQLRQIRDQYFVIVYRSDDMTKIEVFGGNLKKTEYQELRKLLV